MDTKIDIYRPDLEDILISLELPVFGLLSQLEQLLNTIQEDCLIKDRNTYNAICGQITISIAGIEYIKKICEQYNRELEEYFEKKKADL